MKISADAFKKLKKYNWPGNIRELRHIIERTVIMNNGTVLNSQDFVLNISESAPSNRNILNLEEVEKQTIENALKKSFAPEFLNRIDNIVIFDPLDRDGAMARG